MSMYKRSRSSISSGKRNQKLQRALKAMTLVATVYDLVLGLIVVYMVNEIVSRVALESMFPLFGTW